MQNQSKSYLAQNTQERIYDYTDTDANILALNPVTNNGRTAKATDSLNEYICDGISWVLQTANMNAKQNTINTTVNSEVAMLALGSVVVNDIVIRSDDSNALYRLTALPASNKANWQKLSAVNASPVISDNVDGILITNSAIPTVDGTYAIKSVPNAGLPIGVVGDIIQRIGGVWSIKSTWNNAGASIYNKADQKVYNKANTGFNTWNVLVEPLVYTINGTGDNTRTGGYTTYQNAINAYEADFGAGLGSLGVFESYITNTNQTPIINPSNNTQNYYFIGKGTKYRSYTQIAKFTLGRNSHRVTMQGISSDFLIQCSGTINENGAADTPRGKPVWKDCSGRITIESCDNFGALEGHDGSNAVITFADAVVDNTLTAAQIQAQPTTFTGIFFRATDTGRYYKANGTVWQIYASNFSLPTYLYIDNSQNMAIHAGLNRIVTKNQTCSNIFEISNNNNVLSYGFVNGVLTNDTQYDAILALGASAAGYYLANYTRTKAVSAVNATLNTLTITSHGLSSGNLVRFTGTTLPTPIVTGKQYAVLVVDVNTIKIADPLLSLTTSIDITGTTIAGAVCNVFSAGSVLLRNGTNTVVDRQYYNADNIYHDANGLQSYTKQSGLWYAVQRQIPDGNNINQPRSTIASAATVNLNAATSDVINITGTTAITAFTLANGVLKTLVFAGALTLTYNATSLILPTLANITTAAGDSCIIVGTTNGVEILSYQRRGGQPLTLGAFIASLNGISQASTTNVLQLNNQFTAQNGFNYIGNDNFRTINSDIPNPQTGITNIDTNKGPGTTQAATLQLVRNWYVTNNEATSRVKLSLFDFLGKRYVRFEATVGGNGEAYCHRITGRLAELSGKNMMVQFPFKIYDTVIGNVYNLRILYSLDGTGEPISYAILAITVAAANANLEGANRSLLTFSTGVSLAANSPLEDIIKRTLTMRQFIIGTLSTPPASPVSNDAYFVGTSPTGAWAAFPVGSIARWDSTSSTWVNHTNGYQNGFIQFQFERDGVIGTDVCDFAVGEGVKLEQGLINTNSQREPQILADFKEELVNTNQVSVKYLIIRMTQAQILAQPTSTSGKFFATDTGRFFTVVNGVWRRYIPNTPDIGHLLPPIMESKEFFDAYPPVNVLIADGSVYNISSYPLLFNKWGNGFGGNGTTTFGVRDLRGQFIRGADLGSGNDPDNASRTGGLGASKIGSSQWYEVQSHTHTLSNATNVLQRSGGAAWISGDDTAYTASGVTSNITAQTTGGAETRPKNISAIYCVVAMMIF